MVTTMLDKKKASLMWKASVLEEALSLIWFLEILLW
jgi:hypothetical protein